MGAAALGGGEGGWLAGGGRSGAPASRREGAGWRFAPGGSVGRPGQEVGFEGHTLRGWYRLLILAFFFMLMMVISNLSLKVVLLPAGASPGGLIWSVTP